MRKDKDGNTLFRKMTIKVVFPDAIFQDQTFVQRAGPRQGFGPEGVDATLMSIADQLDTRYPWWEFAPVELRPIGSTIRFAFIFAGNNKNYVPPAPTINPIAESTTPEPETPQSDNTTDAIKATVGTTLQDVASQEMVPGE